MSRTTRKSAKVAKAARAAAPSHPSPSLALCVIAKDEERFIADCLDSARPFVDEIIVVDTGSTDRTRELAREHGARVEHFTWCDDFAAARNAAIEAATADWILMLDADERLDPASGPHLRRLARQTSPVVHALAPRIENRSVDDERALNSTVAVPRFFPRRPELRFVGAIHEVITYLPDPQRTCRAAAPELRLIHYGYDPQVFVERNKDARNLTLIEREVNSGSDDPRMPFFLLQQHAIAGRWAETVAAFDGFRRALPRLPTAFAVDGYALYLDALGHLGDQAALARAEQDASEHGALGSAALEALGTHAAKAGQLERAIAYRLRELASDLPVGLQQVDGRGSWATRLVLAGLYDHVNQPAAALDQLDQAFELLPADRRPEVTYHTLDYTLRRNELQAAVQWAPRAIAWAPEVLDEQLKVLQLVIQLHTRRPGLLINSPWLELEQALAGSDLQLIYDLGSQLAPRTYADLARLLTVIERVRAADEHQAALALLNRALDGPKSETVYWLLIQTLTTLGRYQDAQLAVEALRAFKRTPPEGTQKAA